MPPSSVTIAAPMAGMSKARRTESTIDDREAPVPAGAAWTVIVAVPRTCRPGGPAPAVAAMTAVPALTAVTRPAASTVATAGASLSQVNAAALTACPLGRRCAGHELRGLSGYERGGGGGDRHRRDRRAQVR